MPIWDKPATPCLSSRIAYGEEVTPERVRMIDQAEQWLRQKGLRVLRVRYHKGDLARIEVPLDDLPRLAELDLRGELEKAVVACKWFVDRYNERRPEIVALGLRAILSGTLATCMSGAVVGIL